MLFIHKKHINMSVWMDVWPLLGFLDLIMHYTSTGHVQSLNKQGLSYRHNKKSHLFLHLQLHVFWHVYCKKLKPGQIRRKVSPSIHCLLFIQNQVLERDPIPLPAFCGFVSLNPPDFSHYCRLSSCKLTARAWRSQKCHILFKKIP